ncbi:hypothetical protein [Kaarinaea lacus]
MNAYEVRFFLFCLLLWIVLGVSACSSGGGSTPPTAIGDGNSLNPVVNQPGESDSGTGNNSNNGGDSGFQTPSISPQAVAITTENENLVVQTALSAASGGFRAGSEMIYSPNQLVGTSSTVTANVYGLLQETVATSILKELQSATLVSASGVIFQETINCFVNGSVSFTGDAVDPNGNSISAGDTITQKYSGCDDGDGVIYDGVITTVAKSDIATTNSNILLDFDVSVSFANFSITTVDSGSIVLHGASDVSLVTSFNGYTLNLAGESLYIISPEESAQLTSFDLSININQTTGDIIIDAVYTVASAVINGHINVDAYLEIAGFDIYPNAGYINVTGDNSQLDISVNDSSTVIMTLMTGGVIESGYPKIVNWSNMAINVCGIANCPSSYSSFVPPEISNQQIQITPVNETAVIQIAYRAIDGVFSSGQMFGLASTGASASAASGSVVLPSLYDSLRRVAVDVVRIQLASQHIISVAGIVVSDGGPCASSGSYVINADIADSTGFSLAPGDRLIATFDNCDDGLGEVTSGTIAITVHEYISDTEFDLSLDYWDYSISTMATGPTAIHGSVRISTSIIGTVSITSLAGGSLYIITPETELHLTDFDIAEVKDQTTQSSVTDATFSVASTAIDGRITVGSHLETENTITAPYPSIGFINIMGDNSQLELNVVNSNSVSVMLLTGGMLESGYPKTVSWTDLGL